MKALPKEYQDSAKQVKVKKSKAGLGLFAAEPIKKGSFIIEYFGTSLTNRQANEKGGKYLFQTSANRVIDGTKRDNIARYINHSCAPNAEAEIHPGGRVFIFALKDIEPGEEIGYDYGKEYFDEHIKPFGCRCASCSV